MKKAILFFSILLLSGLYQSVYSQRNVDLMIMQTQQMLVNGDYINAIKLANEIVILKPYLYEPFFLRGVSKFYLEDYYGALVDLDKAIELKTNSPSAFQYRALTRERMSDFDGAMRDFKQALYQNPNNPDIFLNRAITYLYLEQFYNAISDCNRAINLDPKMQRAFLIRGAAKTGLDDFIDALNDYNQAIKLNRFDANAYLRRGMVRYELLDLDGAIADFNEAITINNENSYAYFSRAVVNAELNNLEEALADLNKVLEIEPDNSLTYFRRAIIYSDLGEIDKSIEDYSLVASINPDNLMVYFNRGNLYLQKEQYKKAIADFTSAINIYPDFLDAYGNRAIAKSQLNDNKGATIDYDKARELEKAHYAKTHDQLVAEEEKIRSLIDFKAEFYQSEKDKEKLQNKEIDIDLLKAYSILWAGATENEEYFDFSLKQLGKSIDLPMKAAINMDVLSEQEIRKAIDSLSTVIAHSNENIGALFKRANLYGHLKNYHDAIIDYDRIIEIDPDFGPAYLNRGVLQSQLIVMFNAFNSSQNSDFSADDYPSFNDDIASVDIVKADFEKAAELMPLLPYAYYNLGNIYCAEQDYNQGFALYDLVIEINPNMGEAFFNKGITMIFLSDTDNGCAYISKAGELGIKNAYSVLKRFCN
jgi:tetratricopeptide (TPR) repeat protein